MPLSKVVIYQIIFSLSGDIMGAERSLLWCFCTVLCNQTFFFFLFLGLCLDGVLVSVGGARFFRPLGCGSFFLLFIPNKPPLADAKKHKTHHFLNS